MARTAVYVSESRRAKEKQPPHLQILAVNPTLQKMLSNFFPKISTLGLQVAARSKWTILPNPAADIVQRKLTRNV